MAEATLTTREQEVLDLHDAGKKNVEIAQQLGIQAGTVSNALTKALRKLGRESDIGGGGNGGSTQSTAGATLSPKDMFQREGAKVIRRAVDARSAVENFPADFESWLEQEREALEKQYTQRMETMTEQADKLDAAAAEWRAIAPTLGIDLDEVESQAASDDTAAEVAAEADADSDSDEDEDEDDGEESDES